MNNSLSIQTGLYLPAPEIEALTQGRVIVAITKLSIRPGQTFALVPANNYLITMPIEAYYNQNFLSFAKTSLNQLISGKISIKAWAKCEIFKILDETAPLETLSQLTLWTPEALREILNQQQYIFLCFLRVYQLTQTQEIPSNLNLKDKIGKFITLTRSFSTSYLEPIFTDKMFQLRQKQLETLQPPAHPELEELQAELEFLKINNTAAKKLQQDIQIFLGWKQKINCENLNNDLAWINDIGALGTRSKLEDEGNSSYQAGTDFENIVRKSLEFLGFTIDYSHKGGAGGLDLFCSQPYPLVGECKAGKKIPNDTAVQLLNLGTLRLKDAEELKKSTKLIIGPGEPTHQLIEAAKVHDMAIIHPDTLEKLVKLQARYHNAIDLLQLKKYLKSGQSDREIDEYICQIQQNIELRSQIVQKVKEYQEMTESTCVSIDALHGFIIGKSIKIEPKELHEILIELSSPLTGYLGRSKGEDWKRVPGVERSYRFYYLRDLL